MKLFGKELFTQKAEEELYDFAQHGLIRSSEHYAVDIAGFYETSTLTNVEGSSEKKKKKKEAEPTPLTPKEVYELETLNDTTYVLNTDTAYIDHQVKILRKKANLLPQVKKSRRSDGAVEVTESYGASKYGRLEVESLIERLENRKMYKDLRDYFEQYPYTTSALINSVLKEHKNLRSKRVEEFIPDMPEEAVEAMESYNKIVKDMTGKRAVFYIIADRKDFGEIDQKRDPILLAQSPFGLGWQILGAWDEEMVFLGDL